MFSRMWSMGIGGVVIKSVERLILEPAQGVSNVRKQSELLTERQGLFFANCFQLLPLHLDQVKPFHFQRYV